MKTVPIRAASTRAFTLIEILVVITIIAILAALLLNTAGYVQEKAGNSRAEVEIKSLEAALEAYKQDMGTYPDSGSSCSTQVLLDALNPQVGNSTSTKVYFEIPPKMMDSYRSGLDYTTVRNSATHLVDPFGNPYYYYFSQSAAQAGSAAQNPLTNTQNNGPQFFDLWSYGKAGQAKNAGVPAKWIKNW